MKADKDLPQTLEFMNYQLALAREGRSLWYGVFEIHGGDLHLRVKMRTFGGKTKPRWYGQLSYKIDAPPLHSDDPRSRTLLEVDTQGVSRLRMQREMVRRVEQVSEFFNVRIIRNNGTG